MATSFMASMLDELMGRNRNLAPTEKQREVKWDDPEMCKNFLCGFCPHELFVNTRADLGPCDRIHDDDLRKEYQKSSRYMRMGFEEDFLKCLQSMLSDVEKRIRRGQARLALNSTQGGQHGVTPQAAREEKVEMLTERINQLVEQAEKLGCEGKVEEAQGVMKLCDQLKEERNELDSKPQNVPQLKEMEVCETCGAFLVVGDAQQRLEEHLLGKQHMGYAKVRETIEALRRKLRGEDPEREAKLAKEKEEREKEREREREQRRKRLEEREKEREKERAERRRRSRSRSRGRRSRSRSRGKHRRRTRSRERRRSRSRDRHHRRSRSRSRDRDRSRGHRSRRSRSHSRSQRHSRSRSRSRKSSRGKDRKSETRDHSRDARDDRDNSREERGRSRDKRDDSREERDHSREGRDRSESRAEADESKEDRPRTPSENGTKMEDSSPEDKGDSN